MTSATITSTNNLGKLYVTRVAVQFLWAALVIAFAPANPGLAAVLLVLYTLWDIACTFYDLRRDSNSSSGTRTMRYSNVAFGLCAAVGVGIFATSHPSYAVVTFGAWAAATGLLQLAVGVFGGSSSAVNGQ